MTTEFSPAGDRVLLTVSAPETTSAGGIVLPPVAQEKSLFGTVVAVGPGKLTDKGVFVETRFSKGDRVMFGKYAGTELTLNGSDYLLVSSDDILGTLRDF